MKVSLGRLCAPGSLLGYCLRKSPSVRLATGEFICGDFMPEGTLAALSPPSGTPWHEFWGTASHTS